MEGELPKVTPWLLRAAETMCSQRLAADFHGAEGSSDPVNRSRLRDAFLEAARAVHATSAAPTVTAFPPAPVGLTPEELAVFRQAARWYVALFGDRAVMTHLHDCDAPTPTPARGVRVGGWVDLTVIADNGTRELRQLRLWDSRMPNAALDAPDARVAVLRLARWIGDEPLRVSIADLVHGDLREEIFLPSALDGLREWFDERLAVIREVGAAPAPRPGTECGSCRFVGSCPAHPQRAHGSARRGDLRPGIITLSPSAIDRWSRCARLWHNRDLLRLPPSNHPASPDHGLLVHELLHQIHVYGSCHDRAHVDDVLEAHGVDGPGLVRESVEQHERRCPSPSDALGHELELARFHRSPWPLFMGTARLDAVWIHDGLLDARDYKTGSSRIERVGDDIRARLQAWLLAPTAERLGLQLRVRYECLAPEIDDDPEAFAPTAEDLDAIENELREVVIAMWNEETFAGVHDPIICSRCEYRAICPDSAAPSEPSWPSVDVLDDDIPSGLEVAPQ